MLRKDNPLRQEKRRKLQEIRKLSLDPYPHNFTRTIKMADLHVQFDGLAVAEKREDVVHSVAGRLMARRDMGKSVFLDLQEGDDHIQIYLNRGELDEETGKLFELLDLGDIIGVQGFVFKTKMGELSIHCQTLTMLCKSVEPLPDKFHGLKDQELKYRRRHMDLIMNPEVRKVFTMRSKIITEIRNFLTGRGFMEVETPILQPIYGGASAYPFSTHHKALDMKLFLRISPELYLKRLIVGGFEKVFEIAKNFRNEGIDHTHNPEFSMMEWYEAYTDYLYQMQQFEDLTIHLVKSVHGTTKITYQGTEIDFKSPWRRLTVYDGLREYANIEPETISEADLLAKLKSYDPNYAGRPTKAEMLMDLFDEAVEKQLIQPTFVIDHPVEVSPLTKKNRHNDRLVERFEPFVCGMEIGNAYSELNDPEEQFNRLADQEAKRVVDDEAQPMDLDFVNAIETGMPPTGGVGYGIERIVMLLTDCASIRDAILFPTLRPLNNDEVAEY